MKISSILVEASKRLRLAPSLYWRMAVVVVLAFAFRIWFIRGGQVVNPMLGDAVQYCDYAWNLSQSHVFSMALPGALSVVPDSYRDPGYPLFLASLLLCFGSGDTWYYAVLIAQAALGALSAGLAMLIATRWLGPRAVLLVGLATALWPHNVAISGFLLSETLCGFMVLLATWLLARASETTVPGRWAAAGCCFGAAALVNATLAPFGLLLAACLMIRKATPKPLLAALLIGSLALPGAWAIRSWVLPSGNSAGGRAMTNLVQGSWAEYHSAYIKGLRGDEKSEQLMSAIDTDMKLAGRSPVAWLSATSKRIGRDPWHYIAWYAWKPELLWAWSIRVGGDIRIPYGDIYPYPIDHPIFKNYPLMRWFESLCLGINPLLFILMVGALITTLTASGNRGFVTALYAAALLIAYETFVYSVLQSEPRYSIPFRPFEMMLATTAIQRLWRHWRMRKNTQAIRSNPGDQPLAGSQS